MPICELEEKIKKSSSRHFQHFGMKVAKLRSHIKRHKKIWIFITIMLIICTQFNAQYYVAIYNNLSLLEDFNDLEYFADDKNITVSNLPHLKRAKPNGNLDYKPDFQPCRIYPVNLEGSLISDMNTNLTYALPWDKIKSSNPRVSEGSYSPPSCKPLYKVAIIIPLRNRETQLRVLLSHMHKVWQRQEIDYTVYTITQTADGLFNRAKLINVGVKEARKDRPYDCFVFHDVDLLLEDDRCLYWCNEENPRHIAMYMDKFSYEQLTYLSACRSFMSLLEKTVYFGGVSMMTSKQFDDVNGFSNLYWGWGGEDDDMFFRLQSKGYSVSNPYERYCSFRMITHEHESTNAENEARHPLIYHAVSRMKKDGFGSLRYKLLSIERLPLYVNITVDIGRPSKRMVDFISKKLTWFNQCVVRVPWRM